MNSKDSTNSMNSSIKDLGAGLTGLRGAWNRFQSALPVSSHPEREYAVRAALMLFALGLGILFAQSETNGLSRRAEGYQTEQLHREAKMLASETAERLELIQSQVMAFRDLRALASEATPSHGLLGYAEVTSDGIRQLVWSSEMLVRRPPLATVGKEWLNRALDAQGELPRTELIASGAAIIPLAEEVSGRHELVALAVPGDAGATLLGIVDSNRLVALPSENTTGRRAFALLQPSQAAAEARVLAHTTGAYMGMEWESGKHVGSVYTSVDRTRVRGVFETLPGKWKAIPLTIGVEQVVNEAGSGFYGALSSSPSAVAAERSQIYRNVGQFLIVLGFFALALWWLPVRGRRSARATTGTVVLPSAEWSTLPLAPASDDARTSIEPARDEGRFELASFDDILKSQGVGTVVDHLNAAHEKKTIAQKNHDATIRELLAHFSALQAPTAPATQTTAGAAPSSAIRQDSRDPRESIHKLTLRAAKLWERPALFFSYHHDQQLAALRFYAGFGANTALRAMAFPLDADVVGRIRRAHERGLPLSLVDLGPLRTVLLAELEATQFEAWPICHQVPSEGGDDLIILGVMVILATDWASDRVNTAAPSRQTPKDPLEWGANVPPAPPTEIPPH